MSGIPPVIDPRADCPYFSGAVVRLDHLRPFNYSSRVRGGGGGVLNSIASPTEGDDFET